MSLVIDGCLVQRKQERKSSASQDNPSVGKSTKPLPKVPNPPTRCQKTLKYGDKKCVPACVRVCHVYKPGLEQFCHELLRPSPPPFSGPPGWWGGGPQPSHLILLSFRLMKAIYLVIVVTIVKRALVEYLEEYFPCSKHSVHCNHPKQ